MRLSCESTLCRTVGELEALAQAEYPGQPDTDHATGLVVIAQSGILRSLTVELPVFIPGAHAIPIGRHDADAEEGLGGVDVEIARDTEKRDGRGYDAEPRREHRIVLDDLHDALVVADAVGRRIPRAEIEIAGAEYRQVTESPDGLC